MASKHQNLAGDSASLHVATVRDAWAGFDDPRSIREIVEVSAKVSTNSVYRLILADDSSVIAKVSSYGSFFLFREDHERLHRCRELLQGTRYANLLADILMKDGRVYTHYTGELWTAFYQDVPRRDSLPRVLTDEQIEQLGEEMALFHRACTDIAPLVPPTSKSIKSDAIHLLELLSDRFASRKFRFGPQDKIYLRHHCHDFLEQLDRFRYDESPKIPTLIDWNLGNFSVETIGRHIRLFSRWDYDWFRIDSRMLDFYFLSRVSSKTGDRTIFTYSPHTLVEPRFQRFLAAYHRIFPLSVEDVMFLREGYRFFVLNYVVREGDNFFQSSYWNRLQSEVVSMCLPALDHLDLSPLFEIVT